jgi:hypothetical protein
MTTIHDIRDKISPRPSILVLSQVLDISPSAVEKMAADNVPLNSVQLEKISLMQELDINNKIFGQWSLKTARSMLGVSVAEMAPEYQYSESAWNKFECNTRRVPDWIIRNLETKLLPELLAALKYATETGY